MKSIMFDVWFFFYASIRFNRSWIKDLPDGDSDKKRKYLKSLRDKCNEDQLPRQPSKNDYGRLIKAYGNLNKPQLFMISYYCF